MARGPKPKPAAVRDQLAPVRSKRKPPAETAAPATDAPAGGVAAPTWLKGEGRKIWDQEAPGFMSARLLGRTDVISFARWCETMANWLSLSAVLKEKGEFYEVKSAHGQYIRAHPAASRIDRLEVRLVALEDRFGGNPSARQRIIAARAQQPLGDLFGQGAAAPALPAAGDPTDQPASTPADAATGFLN